MPSEELKHEAAVCRFMPGRAPPGCDVEDGFEEAGLEAFEVILVREGRVCRKQRGGERERRGQMWVKVAACSQLLPPPLSAWIPLVLALCL